MNTLKIITLILIVAMSIVLSGCSESMTVSPETRIAEPGSEQSSTSYQSETETPWWVDGGVDPDWAY